MFNIIVSGSTGRAGSTIVRFLRERGFRYVYRYTANLATLPLCANTIVIDFTNPANLNSLLRSSICYRCKLIIGTTGYSKPQIALLKQFAAYIPIFISSNFNSTFLLYLRILRYVNNLRSGMAAVVVETHNLNKKDAPSGSAKLIAKVIKVNNIFSLRYGNEIGTHALILSNSCNTITLKHKCLSRRAFVDTLPYVIKFLLGKSIGFYTFKV
ncbi:dihydrodipicolinate reductase C-terminal domain-containing protein [Candidatus Vidania fulgoroideorum]